MVLEPKTFGRCKAGFEAWLCAIRYRSESIKQDIKQLTDNSLEENNVAGGKTLNAILEKIKGMQEEYEKFDDALGKADVSGGSIAQCCKGMADPCQGLLFSEYIDLQES
ncbi:hypothetical protein QFC22_006669 [Naganishia vaughanmartiniae]|uniref:Uncharacterized protein n=1 Tax=Naganishia vaughanmartiniae TaxID=1424756 RepID=A0ACC2WGE0_9TREE|nr:hypothetical protein QFC22_006669 [Naganishia vaughanmartiniae]